MISTATSAGSFPIRSAIPIRTWPWARPRSTSRGPSISIQASKSASGTRTSAFPGAFLRSRPFCSWGTAATPRGAVTPANPTQTITDTSASAPNYTEYGQNFTIIVAWDEAFRTGTSIPPVITTYTFNPAEMAKSNLNAGGTLNLFVGTDGSINWSASSLNPGTGSGVVNFTITRTYPLAYLATVTQGLHASVTVVTDSSLNFTIAGERIDRDHRGSPGDSGRGCP